MIIYTIIILLLSLLYIFLFFFYLAGWIMLPVFTGGDRIGSTKVSIIVPARNEEQHIGNIISDLLAQSYPAGLLEIIVVDDYSRDQTIAIVRSFDSPNIKVLQLKDALSSEEALGGKKQAIALGIKLSEGDLIITTDADCRMNDHWLHTIVGFYEWKKCHMIVAPVLFSGEKKFFERFQSLDFLGLTGITGATLQMNFPTMCNGANLAFTKKSFEEVGGYGDIDHVSSGDDMLLMHKIARRWPKEVFFLKNRNAAVYTFPAKSVKEFMNQRLRWASKSKHYKDHRLALNLSLVYLFNLSLLVTLALSLINIHYVLLFSFQFILKLIAEFSFLSQVTKFFNRQKLLSLFLPSQVVHICYIVVVGALGNFIKPPWKGRKIR